MNNFIDEYISMNTFIRTYRPKLNYDGFFGKSSPVLSVSLLALKCAVDFRIFSNSLLFVKVLCNVLYNILDADEHVSCKLSS